MLEVFVKGCEQYDENKNIFVSIKDQTLKLEHSLLSISKWESKWHKPFINKENKSTEEVIDYIKCMTINTVNDDIYKCINDSIFCIVNNYISDPMTATTFNDINNRPSREIITSEIIYYWMITYNIPFECEKWHLNKLLTLIKVCNNKNNPDKKMSRSEVIRRNKELNNKRRMAMNSKG